MNRRPPALSPRFGHEADAIDQTRLPRRFGEGNPLDYTEMRIARNRAVFVTVFRTVVCMNVTLPIASFGYFGDLLFEDSYTFAPSCLKPSI